MKEINLRELYPDTYNTDTFVEVADEVWAAISSSQRAEAAYERRKFRHKAHYSLDYGNGIEKAAHQAVPTPEELLYAAVMSLPEKQAKRIYARFYLGMTAVEIAHAEGVHPSRVRESIRRGLKKLARLLGTAR